MFLWKEISNDTAYKYEYGFSPTRIFPYVLKNIFTLQSNLSIAGPAIRSKEVSANRVLDFFEEKTIKDKNVIIFYANCLQLHFLNTYGQYID